MNSDSIIRATGIGEAQGVLDRLTKVVAVKLSRRVFAGSVLFGGAATLAVQALGFAVPVAEAQTACNSCCGPCGCASCSPGQCCSPNGQWCAGSGCCKCGLPTCALCGFGGISACVLVCDNGGTALNCPGC